MSAICVRDVRGALPYDLREFCAGVLGQAGRPSCRVYIVLGIAARMEDGQLSPLSASDYESSSSFRQLASDGCGVSWSVRESPQHKAEKAPVRATPGPGRVEKEDPESWLKLPGHVHFDESFCKSPRNPRKPLQLIGHHLEPKDPGQPEGEQLEEVRPRPSAKKPKPVPSKRGQRWLGHPPRPASLPQRRNVPMEVCGSPLRADMASFDAPARQGTARWNTAELQSETGTEECLPRLSAELPAVFPKPKQRVPLLHAVSKEAMTGEDDEKPELVGSASSFIERGGAPGSPSFYADLHQVPSPGRNGDQSPKASDEAPKASKRQGPAKCARTSQLRPSQTAEKTDRAELLPREFAKISRMIAAGRAKHQRKPADDVSQPVQVPVETASVDIQCEEWADLTADPSDPPGILSGRTFMLFRCDPCAVSLEKWHRLEYPPPPISKLQVYLNHFAYRFPGALDPWLGFEQLSMLPRFAKPSIREEDRFDR